MRRQRIAALQTGVQTWCEANRVTLLGEDDRHGKTANLVTGEVSWRVRPPSVSIRGADAVLDYTREASLAPGVRFEVVLDAVGKAKTSRLRVEVDVAPLDQAVPLPN